jgi:carbon storage regulator
MLVLSRKCNEKIRVGENITVTVVRIGPNTVRLGIDAPPDLNIVRTELLDVVEVRTETFEAAVA